MNEFLKAMKNDTNYGYTENGGVKHNSTLNKVLDMFAMGGSMRSRPDDDLIHMFKCAYGENSELALRCLFYLRDVRGGQGERRFFRVILHWMGNHMIEETEHLIPMIAEYGRWDDLFELFNTKCEPAMLGYIYHTINKNEDHLIYKWLPSINASSRTTKSRGRKIAQEFSMTEREYRKMLTEGRKACNLVETLMSQNQWDQIAFDKLPSRAGLLYKNAFMRREETKARYAEFMSSEKTKVNASVLNPVEIAHQIFNNGYASIIERQAWQKYWDNLKDYYGGREEPGIAIVDVSGSMYGQPLEAAVSMGAYIAERGKGPFRNHFITFTDYPELVEFEGRDIYDKFMRARNADWGGSTNIEAVFDMLLNTALQHHTPAEDMPKTLYIFSDMEFNGCITGGTPTRDRWSYGGRVLNRSQINTVIEVQAKKWQRHGYKIPRVVFWNLDARHDNIPAIGDGFSYVSGFSMNMVECILSGKDGVDLMLEKLNSARYQPITSFYK